MHKGSPIRRKSCVSITLGDGYELRDHCGASAKINSRSRAAPSSTVRTFIRMPFERVFMVWDIYDGARSGLACLRGKPHYFDCEIDRVHGGYTDIYQLWPIDEELLTLATAQWQLYRAWELRFHSGDVPLETHPGHRGQNARYDDLEDEIHRRLSLLGTPTCRALADFRACAHQPELPAGCLRELEVQWVAVA
jgi:hypothetical protein